MDNTMWKLDVERLANAYNSYSKAIGTCEKLCEIYPIQFFELRWINGRN